MPGKIHRLSTYRFRDTDQLLFDANVWLFLYSPQYGPNDSRVRVYSAALKKILAARSHIHIDALVLSEFINTWARFAYNTIPTGGRPRDFKTYRNSSAFNPIGKGIADACRRILRHATRIDSEFPSLNIDAVLSGYEAGKADFNDCVLVELCVTKGFTFVTDDGDFKGLTLTILTENRNLLA